MKKGLFFMVMLIALGFVVTSSGFGQGRPTLGGFRDIETINEGAVAAANFAVAAQSEATEMDYQLVDISKAESQVVAGTNYRLCLEVSANGSDSSFVQAIVAYDLQRNYHLTSWAGSTCGGGSDETSSKAMP